MSTDDSIWRFNLVKSESFRLNNFEFLKTMTDILILLVFHIQLVAKIPIIELKKVVINIVLETFTLERLLNAVTLNDPPT